MTTTMTTRVSPLDQARRQNKVAMAESTRELSARDQATLKRVLTSKCDFVPNPLFEKANAQRQIFDEAPPIGRPDTSWYHPVMDNATDSRSVNTGGTVLRSDDAGSTWKVLALGLKGNIYGVDDVDGEGHY